MNKKNIFVITVVFILIAAISVVFVTANSRDHNHKNKDRIPLQSNVKPDDRTKDSDEAVNQDKETSMKEAIDLAMKEVEKHLAKPVLQKIISTDAQDNSNLKSGMDGERNTWNVFFQDKENHKAGWVTVCQNEPEYHTYDVYDVRTIKDSDIKIDSNKALEIAQEKKKLKPGNPKTDWAVGYHFDLEYTSYYEKPGKEFLILEVIGISPKGNFAHVDIDAKTGKIIYSGEKTYDKDGNAVWKPF